MSEQPVRKSDLIEGDPIGEISKDLEEGLVDLENYDQGLKDIAKTLSTEFKTATTETLKGIEAINKAEINSEKLLQEKIKTEKQIIVLEQQKAKLDEAKIKRSTAKERQAQAEIRTDEQRAKAAKRVADQIKKEAAAEAKLIKQREKARDPLKRLVRLTKQAKEQTQRLALTQGKNSERTKIAQKRYENLDNTLKRVQSTTKNGRKSLTQLIATNNKLGLSFRRLTSLASQFGLALGGATLIRGTVSILSEFDEKIADVAKTTGLSTEAARDLSKELLKIDTRTSITELQELASAAGRLGIEGEANLIGFATAADKVFVALGDDLEGSAEEIATNLGKISTLFGVEAEFGVEEGIERVGSSLNELSAKSKASAGAIQNFTNRMAGLSGVLEVEDVQALGALFDEAGQSMEVASSTLIKLLPNMVKDFDRFAKVAGETPEAFKQIAEESPIEALKLVAKGAKNNEKGLFNLNAVLKSYGVESARASGIVSTLTNNVDRLTELQNISKTAMEENLSITKEFNTKNDTLAATYEKAINKIKAFILGSEGASKITDNLKNALRFLAENIGTIVTVLGKAIKLFIAYRIVLASIKLKDKIQEQIDYNKALKETGDGAKGATAGVKAFGQALQSIAIAAAITLIYELATAFWAASSGANALADAQARVAKQTELSEKKANETIKTRNEQLAKSIKLAEQDAELNQTSSEDLLAIKEALLAENEKLIEGDIKLANIRKAALIDDKEQIGFIKARLEAGRQLSDAQLELAKRMGLFGKDATGLVQDLLADAGGIDVYKQAVNELQAEIVGANVRIGLYKNELKGASESLEDLNHEQKILNKGIGDDKVLSLRRKIVDEQIKQIRDVQERERTAAIEKNVRAIEDLRKTTALESEKVQLTIELNKNLETELAKIRQDAIDKAKETERKAFDERLAFQVEQSERANTQILEAEVTRVLQTGIVDITLFNARMEHEKALRKAIIERQFLESINSASNAEEVIAAQEERNRQLIRLDQEFIDKKKEGLEELNLAQEEFREKKRANDERLEQERLEALKEELEVVQQVQQAITDALSKEIDRRIALQDKALQSAKSNQEFFKQLAINGNIEAKESIKEQIQFEKEAQREKERLERRKAQLAVANTFLKVLENELADGENPAQAIASATLTSGIITGILSDILFFEKGTQNAPEGLAFVDEKGAEMITDKKGNIKTFGTDGGPRLTHLEAGDKVFTAAQTAREMSRLDDAGHAQRITGRKDIAGNSYDLISMKKDIASAFASEIRKIPHSKTEWGGVVNGLAKMTTENIRGNDVERTNTWIS